jgi:hypothetical protein
VNHDADDRAYLARKVESQKVAEMKRMRLAFERIATALEKLAACPVEER